MNASYYLGKQGRVFGPFTDEEFRQMKLSGEVLSYSWYWVDGPKAQWQPIDAQPPSPAEAQKISEEKKRARLSVVGKNSSVGTGSSVGIDAICHDSHDVISGKLRNISEFGCMLISPDSESPSFGRKAKVVLNLVDPKSGQSFSLPAQLRGVSREEGKWVYQLQWQSLPEILSERNAA